MFAVPWVYGIDVQSLRKMTGESTRFAGLCSDSPAVIAPRRTTCLKLSGYRDFSLCNDGFSVQLQTKRATPGQILNREYPASSEVPFRQRMVSNPKVAVASLPDTAFDGGIISKLARDQGINARSL
jgi:hypothetical protein